jgi:hypothetical protein
MAKKANNNRTEELGRNVKATVAGDILTLEIDLSAKTEPSMSGKTLIVATTQGNKSLGDVKIGLNIYKYKDKK